MKLRRIYVQRNGKEIRRLLNLTNIVAIKKKAIERQGGGNPKKKKHRNELKQKKKKRVDLPPKQESKAESREKESISTLAARHRNYEACQTSPCLYLNQGNYSPSARATFPLPDQPPHHRYPRRMVALQWTSD